MFLYGCVVYELMKGHWPGVHPAGWAARDVSISVHGQRWPALETEHMGQIARKCWAGEYENVDQLKADVVAFLEERGWFIEGEDNMRGLDFTNLLSC
jgi:hypothetical protein